MRSRGFLPLPAPPHTPGLTLGTVLEWEVGVAANLSGARTRVMASSILPKGAAPSAAPPGVPHAAHFYASPHTREWAIRSMRAPQRHPMLR